MKNILHIGLILLMTSLVWIACDPQEDDDFSLGVPPTEDQLSYKVTQSTEDPFSFTFENTSTVTSTTAWNIAGTKKSGNKIVHKIPLPGDYEFEMTVITSGGSASIKGQVTQTETDYAFLESDELKLLSGGASAVNGKTWVLDSLASGHLAVGEVKGGLESENTVGTEWWSASPLQKKDVNVLYDDEMTFKLVDFVFEYENHGESYVKDFRKDDPAYSNQEQRDTDYKVDFTPGAANWSLEEIDGTFYINFIPSEGLIFPLFDTGGTRYKVLTLEENKLELVTVGSDGLAWHTQYIPKGYVKPLVTFDMGVVAATEANTYDLSLVNVVIPEGQAISNVVWDFGTGETYETSDYNEEVSYTYMRKGNYKINVKVESSAGEFTASHDVTIADHHPDYVEFILDEMVMYNDFSEIELAPVNGEDATVTVVDNPSIIYPNRSLKVAHYKKENNQWANANMKLPAGYRFDLRNQHIFKLKVYGKAGDEVLFKLENTDRGGNAWQTGVELRYTIQADNTWEIVEFDLAGVGAGHDWTGDIFTSDVTTDDNFSHDFYNIIRIMLNPGNGDGVHEFYFDELAGPHVEGVKSGRMY